MTLPAPPKASPDEAASRPSLRALTPRLLVSLLIAGGFVWLFRRGGLRLTPPGQALSATSGPLIAAYVVLTLLATYWRTCRWIHLLRPLAPNASWARVFGIGLVGFTAVFLAPLRSGEVVRPYLLAQDGEISFLQAMGTVGAERIVDGLVLALITFVALSASTLISPLPNHLGDLPLPVSALPAAVYGALLVFSVALVTMLFLYRVRHAALRTARAVLSPLSPGLAAWVVARLERLADGLSFLPSRRHLVPFLRDTLLYMSALVLAQWVLLRAVGLTGSGFTAGAILGVIGVGSMVPAGPGFFGAYQISAYSALALFFPLEQVKSQGSALVFVGYVVMLLTNCVPCPFGFWLMSRHPADRAASRMLT